MPQGSQRSAGFGRDGSGRDGFEGDALLRALEALANPHRLRILARLQRHGRAYVSQLARDLGIGRPLLHMHLKRLERAGLVESSLEHSADGKSLNWFAATAFDLRLTPESLADAAERLSPPDPKTPQPPST